MLSQDNYSLYLTIHLYKNMSFVLVNLIIQVAMALATKMRTLVTTFHPGTTDHNHIEEEGRELVLCLIKFEGTEIERIPSPGSVRNLKQIKGFHF